MFFPEKIMERLSDIAVSVALAQSNLGELQSLCNYHDGILGPGWTNFTCERPLVGRFVQIQMWKHQAEYLHFSEVEVIGH